MFLEQISEFNDNPGCHSQSIHIQILLKVDYIYTQFRYATAWEKLLTITGAAFVSIAALGIPYNLIMFGELTQLLVDRTRDGVDTITTPTTITHMNNLFGGGAVM